MGRRRYIGLAVGSLWLVVSSAGFASVALLVVRSPAATALSVAIVVSAAVLIGIAIGVLRAVLQVQDAVQPRLSEGRRMWRRFTAVVAAEGLALTGVTLACAVTQRWALIAPLDLIVVGLHFLPLARAFRCPLATTLWADCSVACRSPRCWRFLSTVTSAMRSVGLLCRASAVRRWLGSPPRQDFAKLDDS